MFNNYSGTYVAALAMFLVPLFMQWGFSEGCSNELMSVGVPALVAVAIMVARYFKGGITLVGTRV